MEKVTNQIHIPLQSGSNHILRKMQRGYNQQKFLEKVDLATSLIKDVSLTTDIVVGFPGETEEDFEETLTVLRYSNLMLYTCFSFHQDQAPKLMNIKMSSSNKM